MWFCFLMGLRCVVPQTVWVGTGRRRGTVRQRRETGRGRTERGPRDRRRRSRDYSREDRGGRGSNSDRGGTVTYETTLPTSKTERLDRNPGRET